MPKADIGWITRQITPLFGRIPAKVFPRDDEEALLQEVRRH
jgi:hypothetical protein